MAKKKNAHLLASILNLFAIKTGRVCIKRVPCVMPQDTLEKLFPSGFDKPAIETALKNHLKVTMKTKYKVTINLGDNTTLLDICDSLIEEKV